MERDGGRDTVLETLSDNHYLMHLKQHRFIVRNKWESAEMKLTHHEWAIAEVLLRNKGNLVAYSDLIRAVWGGYIKDDEPLLIRLSHWHVANLKRKMATASGKSRTPIKTIRKFGYRWD